MTKLRTLTSISALGLLATCSDLNLQSDTRSGENLVPTMGHVREAFMQAAKSAVISEKRTEIARQVQVDPPAPEAVPAKKPMSLEEKLEKYPPTSENLQQFLGKVNTRAISCVWKNALCEELEKMGIRPDFFRKKHAVFSEDLQALDTYESFETQLLESLQPEAQFGNFSYAERLNNATEILARSSLGVYQILPRYWAEEVGKTYEGEEGRKNMYLFLTSKEEQDKYVNAIIGQLAEKHEWQTAVMAAEYYGGHKFVDAMRAKLAGSDEYDALLTGKRYYGYPSVMDYLSEFEDAMRHFAGNEGKDLAHVDAADRTRFFRYAVALRESDFDMQKFEQSN